MVKYETENPQERKIPTISIDWDCVCSRKIFECIEDSKSYSFKSGFPPLILENTINIAEDISQMN